MGRDDSPWGPNPRRGENPERERAARHVADGDGALFVEPELGEPGLEQRQVILQVGLRFWDHENPSWKKKR